METFHSKPKPCILVVHLYVIVDSLKIADVTLIVCILLGHDSATAWLRRLGDTGGWRATV